MTKNTRHTEETPRVIFGMQFERRQRDNKQTYMKTGAYKLYSRDFWILLPNVIKIDPYNIELYRFKVGAFFLRHSVHNVTDDNGDRQTQLQYTNSATVSLKTAESLCISYHLWKRWRLWLFSHVWTIADVQSLTSNDCSWVGLAIIPACFAASYPTRNQITTEGNNKQHVLNL